MPVFAPARFFHLTGHSAHSKGRFTRTADYRTFITRLSTGLAASPQRLISFVVLPDRWHLVVGPTDPRASLALLERVAATLPPGQSSSPSRSNRATACVDIEPLLSPHKLIRRCRDVEREACVIGLVARAQDWPWGSAAERFLMLNRLPLANTPFLTSSLWLDYLNEPHRRDWTGNGPVLGNLAQVPRRLARFTQCRDKRVGVGRFGHENHADSHIEGPEHLVI